MGTMPKTLRGGPEATLSVPIRCRFVLTGVAANRIDLVVGSDQAQLEAAGEPTADGLFRCDTETLVLIFYGRLKLETAIAEGHVVSEGDPALVTTLDHWFKGV